ncbi:MAG: hypothetical protein ACRDHJ_00645 [Actinomycetota bacterium]
MKRGLLALLVATAAVTPAVPARTGVAPPSLEAYRGLASWVDLFEARAWRRPGRAVAGMAARGVRTLFLETSNHSQRRTVVNRAAVGRFIEAAHDRDMAVVAWYLPGFVDLGRDLRRSMAAIRFRTSNGERFDSFALDIEASVVDPPSRRTKRLLSLSRRIRTRAGAGYTLGAIIPSPVGIKLAGDYWPGFPYPKLDAIYDVFVPMGYFTYHVNGATKVHDETAENIRMLRAATGNPTVPVHLIGGVADEASASETRAFVRAIRERGVLGASLYNWSLTRERHWAELRGVPTNPLQSPALPLTLPWGEAVGNVPGISEGHPKEVWFEVPGQLGTRTLSFEGYGIDPGEVEVWVNWALVGEVAASGPGWGSPQSVEVPDALLRDAQPNVIGFVAEGDHPDWSEWGVRGVGLS